MIEIELSILDRLLMPLFLPERANIIDGQLIQDIRSQIAFSPSEIEQFNIQYKDGQITWKSETRYTKIIHLTPRQVDILKNEIQKHDNDGAIPIDAIPLVDKILKLVY